MSFKIDMSSNDIDKQIELLKFYPEIVVKHYKPALVQGTMIVEDFIRPMLPMGNSGRLADTFTSKVTGRMITTIKGQIGWQGKAPPYAHILENGAKAHEIEPKKKVSRKRFDANSGLATKLSWASGWDGGNFVYRTKVRHPGISARGFMAAGFSATQPIVDGLMQSASAAIVHEMAVP
jgi:hypothetical protein